MLLGSLQASASIWEHSSFNRYFKGTKEVIHYYTSRLGSLFLWVILVSCFIFLANDKPYGTMLWATVTTLVLVAGIVMAKSRSPERVERVQAESEMGMILYLAESSRPDLHIVLQRPREEALRSPKENEVYVTFFSPRQGIPQKLGANHFRFAITKAGLHQRIVALLRVLEHELTGLGCYPLFRLAHVLMAGPDGYRRNGFQSDAAAKSFSQFQFCYQISWRISLSNFG